MDRLRTFGAAVAVATLACLAASPVSAADFAPGDNPMCTQSANGHTIACLETNREEAVSGATVTFTSDPTIYDPGERVCLARSTAAYGAYYRIAACTRVNKDRTVTIRAILRQPGTAWYDIGDESCLVREPKFRPTKKCGDNGGVQSTPVKVIVR